MSQFSFHPAVDSWFRRTFAAPTEAQMQAWPAIRDGRHVLIAAPTGSGKTLAAFLAVIDDLVRRGVEAPLADATAILYVSPLKALSNDIQRNLELPLQGIRAELARLNLPDVQIRTFVRTGDTPQSERERMRRRPPHIVVTTPESLYILLTSASGRRMLSTVRCAIVDEIHSLAPNKRGAHLALSLERLQSLTGAELIRIGLSATQKPVSEVARFLVGESGDRNSCVIVDQGHARLRDLAVEVPPAPLETVMSGEVWQQVYARIAELIVQHRTTLVFVNTRRLAERVTRHLSERLGEENVAAHHGSLSKEKRFDAEQRLKAGQLRGLVATASLELGIDIGDVDLVCQIGSPRSISAFLQRAGRSGHALGATPKARLFPLSRSELVECAALLDCVRRGELERLTLPACPLDVLAQHVAAEVACAEWNEDDLLALVRRAHPYRTLRAADFESVLELLATGFSTARGRRGALIHRDSVNRMLRQKRGALLTAVTSGGTIPDSADYEVILEPEAQFIGTVNEDFAVESLAGDIFQLGNRSYRILRVEAGRVRVDDAHGMPPTIPFWLGEAPARSDEFSFAVSRIREEVEARLGRNDAGRAAIDWLVANSHMAPAAAQQIADYLAAQFAALGLLPTQRRIVLERFFDEAGGMQLVIHSPYGSRMNRAWGLSLRKRFCRKFNFELQAAASEDLIILSLSGAHSFPLEEVARYLHSNTVRDVLIHALLDAPMFTARWRWNAATALALPRFRGGKKVPAPLQRMNSEDLLGAIFPDQLACAENLAGEREIPDHPLVQQTISDCLHEAMDVAGLERLLSALESGAIEVVARDVTEPSPFALEILAARPYTFLDDAPLEERRTQAVLSRRWLDPESAADLGKLDADAIRRVREEAWPDARSADELHDALMWLGFLTEAEVHAQPAWLDYLAVLAEQHRVARVVPLHAEPRATPRLAGAAPERLWVAAERLSEIRAVLGGVKSELDPHRPPSYVHKQCDRESALVALVRGRLEGLGPVTAAALGQPLRLAPTAIDAALAALEAAGFVMRGRFTSDAVELQWCERRLLARIHRYTVHRLRREIEPVSASEFMRFLFQWQHVAAEQRLEGPDALAAVIAQLEGFEIPAAAWEAEILPARVSGYEFTWLDDLCLAGRAVWMRLSPPRQGPGGAARGAGPVRSTPIALLPRRQASLWTTAAATATPGVLELSSKADAVRQLLLTQGASFFDEIVEQTGLLRAQAEEALAELVACGQVNSDSYAGLRTLLLPLSRRRPANNLRRGRRSGVFGVADSGRWAPIRRSAGDTGKNATEVCEQIARTLLRRYGVVFWRLLEREGDWLPPWRDLLRALRRLEARGEIRGGRFVAGFSGEQFALPDAVGTLREVRRRQTSGALLSLSAADPLNLAGIIVPGPKVPALTANRILFRDGAVVAIHSAAQSNVLATLEGISPSELKHALLAPVR